MPPADRKRVKAWLQRYGANCPGCGHHENEHIAGLCYFGWGSYCGWTPVHVGNGYGVPAGWHNLRAA